MVLKLVELNLSESFNKNDQNRTLYAIDRTYLEKKSVMLMCRFLDLVP